MRTHQPVPLALEPDTCDPVFDKLLDKCLLSRTVVVQDVFFPILSEINELALPFLPAPTIRAHTRLKDVLGFQL